MSIELCVIKAQSDLVGRTSVSDREGLSEKGMSELSSAD